MVKRCEWVTDSQVYRDYHDHEWGRPLYDDRKLFELLCLEGTQAGLSWLTVLKKRDSYREAFDQFDPSVISQYNEEKIQSLLQNKEIIRNKLKIRSVVTNAQAYMNITKNGQSFSNYLWQFIDGQPIQHARENQDEIPTQTERSQDMSRQLKKDGFKFVGPTICYAFMQASGMVNDHVVTCFCYEEIKNGRN
ncbi:MAG: DNA-3-methyladenine glycosylase I [Alkalibacterium sp.]